MFTRAAVALSAVTAVGLAALTPVLAADASTDSGPTASYIVQFTPGSDRAAEVSKAKGLGMTVTYVYSTAVSGMAVEANAGQVRALQANPNVQLVSPDKTATLSDTQNGATWGLDRSDQRDLPLNGTYTYPQTSGAGVTAYVIDTGILATHQDLAGRVSGGQTWVNDGRGTSDCNGHGTHVAGTIGGTTYGLAKAARLVPLRVFGCTGGASYTSIIAAVDWVAANAALPAVVNMSLGGPVDATLNTAVANAAAKGITFAVAAGNDNIDACSASPASAPAAITVGSTTSTDARSSFSNYGTCLDIFAPGSAITSAWYTSTTATATISGTSMASPHVAGAAALYLAANPSATPQAVRDALVASSTADKVTGPGAGSPNRLLFSDGGPAAPPAPAPIVTGLNTTSGAVGTPVTITGTDLAGATAVRFNGTSAALTVVDATQITTAVPIGATTGTVNVTTPGGTATGPTFTVPVPAPTVTALSVTGGAVGTSVTLTGTNLSGASAVRFNGTSATYTVVSATSIRTTVPAGASTGAVSVTTGSGTATGPVFTVRTAPAAPTIGTASAGTSRNATVRWTLGANGGSAITSHTIRVFQGATSTTVARTITVNGATTTSANVGSLTRGLVYRFTVTATNAIGSSPQSGYSNTITAR